MGAKSALIFLLCFSSLCFARTEIAIEDKNRNEIRIDQYNTIGFTPTLEEGKGYSILKLQLPMAIDGGEFEYGEVVLSNGTSNIAKTSLSKFGINQHEYVGIEINRNIVMVVTFKLTYENTIYIVECHTNAL
jgi:hypothetical protein